MTGKRLRYSKAAGSKSRPYVGWVVTIVIALLLVVPIRHLLVESYRISTDAMQEALHRGDYVLVRKLPFGGSPERGRVVLFNSPLPKDSTRRPLFLSRCIGMPGDTILISSDGYEVNGRQLPHSPRALSTYLITQRGSSPLLKAMQKLNIPVRNWKSESFGYSLSLTTFEEYQLREELTEEMNIHLIRSQERPYRLIVPRKGRAYRLDEASLTACKEAIQAEAGDRALFRDGKLYMDGRETTFFFFEQDYYWMLSDNVNESVDSRHLGFIPMSHIVGSAWLCWFSSDKQRIFKPVD